VVALLGVKEPLLHVLPRGTAVRAGWELAHVLRALGAPGAGLVGQARRRVERDCEWLVHHSSTSPKRLMLRSARSWMRAIRSLRSSGLNRCAKRRCGRR